MTTKQWLERGMFCEQRIKSLERFKKDALQSAVQITQVLKQDVVQTSPQNNAEARNLQYIIDVANINEQISSLKKVMQEVTEVIFSVGNPRYQTVLQLRYLEGKKWDEIADDMAYRDVRTIYRLHIHALESAEKIIKSYAHEMS